jgi:hypothetical protein
MYSHLKCIGTCFMFSIFCKTLITVKLAFESCTHFFALVGGGIDIIVSLIGLFILNGLRNCLPLINHHVFDLWVVEKCLFPFLFYLFAAHLSV